MRTVIFRDSNERSSEGRAGELYLQQPMYTTYYLPHIRQICKISILSTLYCINLIDLSLKYVLLQDHFQEKRYYKYSYKYILQ